MTRRATGDPAPNARTPAESPPAKGHTEPIDATRAIRHSEPNTTAPAIPGSTPTEVARAMEDSTPTASAPARRHSEPITRARAELQARAIPATAPKEISPALATITTLGMLLDDLEETRVANGNRIAALEREQGLSLPHLDVVQKQLRVAEHLAELELRRVWRKHPLAPWAKQFHGVGEKSIARLVALVGDPGERANVAKLWAYCGHGDPRRTRKKGMTQAEAFALGNPAAKKQVWLIASSLLKTGNRGWYDERKAKTVGKLHDKPCVRCGPSGSPAQPGSPWSDAHRHADALRYSGKQFLKELWLASRQPFPESHTSAAGEPE